MLGFLSPSSGGNGSSSGTPAGPLASYLGQVATRCAIPTYIFAGSPTAILSRSAHTAGDDITALKIETPNFYLTGSFVETGTGAAATVASWVEYPRGVYTQSTYGGAATGTAPNNGRVLSDFVTPSLRIPRRAQFWIWQRFVSTGGIVVVSTAASETNAGDGFVNGANGTSVPGASAITQNGGLYFPPSAILAYTTRRSFSIIGDSRQGGVGDKRSGISPDIGEVSRGLGMAGAAYIDLSIPGQSLVSFIGSHANQAAMMNYCSDLIIQAGINDVLSGGSLATIQSNTATVKGYAPGATTWLTTKPPVASSTDSWATVANQTTNANNGVRVNLNNWIRGIPSGYRGYFEIADAVESARDSGKWKAPVTTGPGAGLGPWTADGTHETQMAYEFIRDGGFVNPLGMQ